MTYFYIQNVSTGHVLDIKDSYVGEGGEIIVHPLHGRDNQLWYEKDGMIYSKLNGLVLDIDRACCKVITYPANGGLNQKWDFKSNDIVVSKTGHLLDVCGSNVKASICNGECRLTSQRFRRVVYGAIDVR